MFEFKMIFFPFATNFVFLRQNLILFTVLLILLAVKLCIQTVSYTNEGYFRFFRRIAM